MENYNLNKNEEKNESEKKLQSKNNNFIDRYENFKMIDNKNLYALKNKVLENQKLIRNESLSSIKSSNNANGKNTKINQILEDMCIYGNIIKKQIKMKNYSNSNKYISTSNALKLENKDQSLFALGLIQKI